MGLGSIVPHSQFDIEAEMEPKKEYKRPLRKFITSF